MKEKGDVYGILRRTTPMKGVQRGMCSICITVGYENRRGNREGYTTGFVYKRLCEIGADFLKKL